MHIFPPNGSPRKEIERRGLKVSVAGIPKTIDNEIALKRLRGLLTQRMSEAESGENGVGLVKLMGWYAVGFIAMYSTLASRDVDCCQIPESPFYLEGPGGGLFEFIEHRLRENGHMVIVIAEGGGQNLIEEHLREMEHKDASGNKVLLDVGLWLSHKIKLYNWRIRPTQSAYNIYCTLLVHSAVHGTMARYLGFTVGPVNGRHAYIPIYRMTEKQNQVCITDRMWARLLSSANQPSFLSPEDIEEAKSKRESSIQDLQMFLADGKALSEDGNFSATS
ncbi:ATP-dependent 6-phosphofructokinase 3-like [Nymphaea colorata]|uniref:ATP-dependent 6-phosphofructokinase 3-like n=1 Tax=Nymphaea colorata TaxID=210225 RepID=UPI00129D4B09|nr:ATP-dependent 6-phosphofructokinase 3-like [Nymphaea colorata]